MTKESVVETNARMGRIEFAGLWSFFMSLMVSSGITGYTFIPNNYHTLACYG